MEAAAKCTLHMVASIDGYIASADNSLAWLEAEVPVYEAGVILSHEEIANFTRSIGCYVLGANTYKFALKVGWPYGDTPVIVVTHQELAQARPTVEFYAGDLRGLLAALFSRFGTVWVAGGAMLGQEFLRLGLIDEIRLTIAPTVLGGGLRLFDGPLPESRWRLTNSVAYRHGYVELTYAKRPSEER